MNIKELQAQVKEIFERCAQVNPKVLDMMYMYSNGDTHYFKDVVTREYTVVKL